MGGGVGKNGDGRDGTEKEKNRTFLLKRTLGKFPL